MTELRALIGELELLRLWSLGLFAGRNLTLSLLLYLGTAHMGLGRTEDGNIETGLLAVRLAPEINFSVQITGCVRGVEIVVNGFPPS